MAKQKDSGRSLRITLIIMMLLTIAATALVVKMCLQVATSSDKGIVPAKQIVLPGIPEAPTQAEAPSQPRDIPPREPEHEIARATVLSIGDLLMHGQLITDARQGDGTYNFDYIFPKLTPYSTEADFAVANLETTLAGTAREYSGHPAFNCPDAIVDAAGKAGFDMLLTANNHMYDSGENGFLRTVDVIREKGLVALGTRRAAEEPRYTIAELNGIRVGMTGYTYEQAPESYRADRAYLNKNILSGTATELINSFASYRLERFFTEAQQVLEQMKQSGAEGTVMYIHWGAEYQLTQNAEQQKIAQRLCDMGYDVIVGGHPHVVQPVQLLQSTSDPEHHTVCLYSMGNAVSNQRLGKLTSITTAHTEDGAMFSFTFSKYSDGKVYLDDVSLMPTWTRAIDINGNTVVRDSGIIRRYEILPLDDSLRAEWQQRFGIDAGTLTQCTESWQRTTAITGEGMEQVKNFLYAEKAARDANYQWMAQNAA